MVMTKRRAGACVGDPQAPAPTSRRLWMTSAQALMASQEPKSVLELSALALVSMRQHHLDQQRLMKTDRRGSLYPEHSHAEVFGISTSRGIDSFPFVPVCPWKNSCSHGVRREAGASRSAAASVASLACGCSRAQHRGRDLRTCHPKARTVGDCIGKV